MASPRSSRTSSGPLPSKPYGDSRFDRRLGEILAFATDVFYEKGYEGASMRDLSRATGMSLAGLYYYFESKEKLLYLIQKYTFETILTQLTSRLEGVSDPEQQVRLFILNHLEYFLANQKSMTVLSHEDEVLKGAYGDEIRQIKRRYYQMCRDIVERLRRERDLTFDTRVAVLSLFGMINWIYTWYRPQVDVDAAELGREMADMFLKGVFGAARSSKNDGNGAVAKTAARTRKTASSNI